MPFIYHIMSEYTKQTSINKEKERIESKKSVEYFMKKDIESITNAILIAFNNKLSRFQCKRHCSEKYIEYITQSLKLFFSDSTIFYNYNSEDNSYLLKVDWG